VQDLILPYAYSLSQPWSTTGIDPVERILNPASRMASTLRGSFSSAILFGSNDTFVISVVAPNGTVFPVARDAPINRRVSPAGDLVIDSPTARRLGAKLSSRRSLQGAIVAQAPFGNNTLLVNLGVSIDVRLPTVMISLLRTLGAGGNPAALRSALANVSALLNSYDPAIAAPGLLGQALRDAENDARLQTTTLVDAWFASTSAALASVPISSAALLLSGTSQLALNLSVSFVAAAVAVGPAPRSAVVVVTPERQSSLELFGTTIGIGALLICCAGGVIVYARMRARRHRSAAAKKLTGEPLIAVVTAPEAAAPANRGHFGSGPATGSSRLPSGAAPVRSKSSPAPSPRSRSTNASPAAVRRQSMRAGEAAVSRGALVLRSAEDGAPSRSRKQSPAVSRFEAARVASGMDIEAAAFGPLPV
jgi:hypothetical protein